MQLANMQDRLHLRRLQHAAQARRRMAGIERYVGVTRLQHGEQSDQHSERAFDQHGNPTARFRQNRLYLRSQPIARPAELSVGYRSLVVLGGDGIRRSGALRRHQLLETRDWRQRNRSVVAASRQRGGLLGRYKGAGRDRCLEVGCEALHNRLVVAAPPCHRRCREDVRRVGEVEPKPAALLGNVERKVEPRKWVGIWRDRKRKARQAGVGRFSLKPEPEGASIPSPRVFGLGQVAIALGLTQSCRDVGKVVAHPDSISGAEPDREARRPRLHTPSSGGGNCTLARFPPPPRGAR